MKIHKSHDHPVKGMPWLRISGALTELNSWIYVGAQAL